MSHFTYSAAAFLDAADNSKSANEEGKQMTLWEEWRLRDRRITRDWQQVADDMAAELERLSPKPPPLPTVRLVTDEIRRITIAQDDLSPDYVLKRLNHLKEALEEIEKLKAKP